MNNITSKRAIMRRIYIVWFLRKISSPFAVKTLLLVGLFHTASGAVSMKSIVANSPAPYDISAVYVFISTAFFQTELIVKFIAVSIGAVLVWLIFDSIRSIVFVRSRGRAQV